jgi:hypothetical protein
LAWIDAELALISLAAMLSPTTLTFSIFALVLVIPVAVAASLLRKWDRRTQRLRAA